ncbi:unnamed protein product [Allacma fusca]|uniref:Uncharacterized protein n=1 Tax=Allacma fusca TaxID=39272 RepID=A0A8J2M3R6_9HEXA|nr:unnamed protein product [Allacma fusca]
MVLPLKFLVHLTLFIFVESLTQVSFATLYSDGYSMNGSPLILLKRHKQYISLEIMTFASILLHSNWPDKYLPSGDEIKSEKDLPFVTSQFQASLIITGCSAWAFYDRPSYHGKPVCINATEDGQPVLVRDVTDKNIPYDSIRSARIGCYKQ